MSYGPRRSSLPRGRAIRAHVHPWRGQEYIHTKHENGEWLWSQWRDGIQILGLDRVELPLWRHEKLASADASTLVLLCEGERDVETAERLGFLATTTPSGALVAGKGWMPLYTKILARFDSVAVLEDNDETGRLHHAPKCAAALRPLVSDLRVIRFQDLPESGDLTDWIAAGHTADDLRARISTTPQWSPPEWQEPIPLTEVSGLPEFPTYLLPSWLARHVEAVAGETLTPAAVPAMIDLSALAATCARKIAVHVRDNWTEPLNLYAVTALGPSNLKTPAFKMALVPIEMWEREKSDEMKDEITEAENKQANLRQLLKATREKAGRVKTEKERRDLLKETEKLARELAELTVPIAPQLIANDVTEEALGELLHQQGGRIAIFSDEGGPFKNMTRYQSNGAAIFELFKHAHNGGTVRVNRRNHAPWYIPNAAITFGVMVQPHLLRALKDVPELRGEGLMARILYAVPDTLEGGRDWNTAVGVPGSITDEYHTRIKALLGLPFSSDEKGRLAAHVMELSSEARDLINPFRNEIESRLARGGDLYTVRDWAGKVAGETVRLAALLHLADLAGKNAEPWSVPVPAKWMNTGIRIARDFLVPHAVGAFKLIGGGPHVDLAEEVLAWLRKHRHARFTKRDLHRALRSHVADPKDWDSPLVLLEGNGWLRAVIAEPKKKGRPSEEYDVNPMALEGASSLEPVTPGEAWEGPDHE